MAFIPATNTIRVAVEMTQRGHVTVNVYHVLSPHPVLSADLSTVAAIFASWVTSDLIHLVTTELAVFNLNLRDLTTAAGIIQDYPMTSGNVGLNTPPTVPNSSALVASWRTGHAGRSYRGRTYIPAIATARLVSGSPNEVTTADAALYATMMSNLQGDIATGGYDLVIASFHNGGAARASAVLTTPSAIIVNTLLDSQRRRMKGSN